MKSILHQQIAQNKRRTVLVILAYLGLFLLIGAAIGYYAWNDPRIGIVIALIGGALYSWVMIGQSTSVVMRLNNAHHITDNSQYPALWNIVGDMAIVAQVPMPQIYVIDDPSPNAFATGSSPEKAAVAVTTGLLTTLNREELEGVIAHEFAHIRNYDVRLQTIAIALGAVISILVQIGSRFFLFGGRGRRSSDNDKGGGVVAIVMLVLSLLAIILGPLMATLIQLTLSRNREYLADATAVDFTRNPHGLISALRKISEGPAMKQADPQSATMYISNPFKKSSERDSLFSTHPSTENRISRLEAM